MHVRALPTFAALLIVAGCRPAPAVCPTCPTCPAPEVVAVQPPVSASKEPDEAQAVVPALLNTELAMIVVEAREAPDDADEDPIVALHIRVAPRGGGNAKTLERSSAPVDCAEVQPEITLLHSDEEHEIVDVRVVCLIGEEVIRQMVEHTIVHITAKGTEVDGKIVFTGQSSSIDNRRLAVESDQLDFHVEAGALVVYRQRGAWCDREALKTLLGPDFGGCATRKRTLTLVKRIALD